MSVTGSWKKLTEEKENRALSRGVVRNPGHAPRQEHQEDLKMDKDAVKTRADSKMHLGHFPLFTFPHAPVMCGWMLFMM